MNASASDLDWLHDCLVTEFRYAVAKDGKRQLEIVIFAPSDMGHPAWDGHKLMLTAQDVLLFKWTALGFSTSPETIDAWREVAPDSFSEVQIFLKHGGRVLARGCTVCFHTGSFFDLACQSVDVRIME
jgi:hypothetical protein